VGFVLSLKVIRWVAVTVFPKVSLAVQVTVVVPVGKDSGASLEKVNAQLSLTVGLPNIIVQESETISGGGIRLGGASSFTVTNCVERVVFPAASVTVHVTVVVPIGKFTGALFEIEAIVQLSPVIGAPSATPDAVQASKSVVTVTSAGAVLRGAIVSETVTSWVAETVLPSASETCQTTAVIPREKTAGALLVGIKPPQLSVALATPISTLQLGERISAGIVSTGSSLSLTVMVWVTVVVLLALSVMVHVNRFTPLTKVKVGLSLTTEFIAQLSKTVGLPTSEGASTASQLPGSLST